MSWDLSYGGINSAELMGFDMETLAGLPTGVNSNSPSFVSGSHIHAVTDMAAMMTSSE